MKEHSRVSRVFVMFSNQYIMYYDFSKQLAVIFHCFLPYAPFAEELGNTALSFSQSITAFLSDAINGVIYHEAATRGLITSPRTKTNSWLWTFRAFEKSQRIHHCHPDYVIYISLNEDRCYRGNIPHSCPLSYPRDVINQ